MFQIYLGTGVLLLIIPVVVSVYLIYMAKLWGINNNTLLSLLEAFVSVCVGMFYVYASLNLKEMEEGETSVLLNITGNNSVENMMGTYYMNEDTNTIKNDTSTTTASPTKNEYNTKNDDFFVSYQHLLKNILKNQMKNKTAENKPRNYGRKLRNDKNNDCFKKTFLEQATVVYSFVHNILSIANTAYFYIKEKKKTKKEFLATKQTSETTDVVVVSNETLQSVNSNENDNSNCERNDEEIKKCSPAISTKSLLCTLLNTILTPILCVIILYVIISQSNQKTSMDTTNDDDIQSVLNLIQRPINVSTLTNTSEVNLIIRNVYKIINNESITKTLNHTPLAPVKYDILQQLNRHPKEVHLCDNAGTPLKVFVLMIFIVAYSVIVYIAKVLQVTELKSTDYNHRLYSFALLWLPYIIVTFTRTYLSEYTPELASVLTALLGNGNHLYFNLRNAISTKQILKQLQHVGPQH